MDKTLIIAEKPSVAADIVKALPGKFSRTKTHFESDKHIVSFALGHLVSIAYPEEIDPRFQKWSLDNLPILPEEFPLNALPNTKTQFNALQKLIRRRPIRALGPMSYPEFLALPLVSTQVAPATAALAPNLMERTLELADSYLLDGLFSQARAIVSELQLTLPEHPLVLEKAGEIEELAAASSGVSAVAQPLVQPGMSSMPAGSTSEAPEMELEYEELEPGDEGFDFAEKLAEELAEVAEIAPLDEGAEMIDVETVFEQFKAGVAEQVSDDDSDTHFDLGIAYKEMGLMPDARREFQVAMADPRRRCLCWTMIGLIYMEEGQPRDAIEAFQSGLESPEKTPAESVGMHYELAIACEASGLTDQARLHYEFVFQREPDLREVGQRLQRLGGPSGESADDLLMESMDDVNRAFDELIHEE